MSAVVNIHEGIIPWICSIADPMAVSANATDLKAWEDGKKPTVAQVDKMSRALRVPFGYFFLSSPHKTTVNAPSFRPLGSKSKEDMSPDLRETVSNMEVIQEWLKDEIAEEGLGPSPIAGIIDIHDDVLLASNRLRELLGLETDWYRELDKTHIYSFLREKAGDNQVFIFENGVVGNNSKRVLDLEEFRAFALHDENAPVVFINARDNAQAKAFSLLHELVHMASGQNDLMEGTDIGEEGFCNSIAAEIMAPG